MLLSYGITGSKTFAGELTRWSGARWVTAPRTGARRRFYAAAARSRSCSIAASLLLGWGFEWFTFTFAAGIRRGSDSVPNETGRARTRCAATGSPRALAPYGPEPTPA